MKFEIFFRLISYAVVVCGFLSLWISGSLGILVTAFFVFSIALAWKLEDSRWQISEWFGTALVLVIVPVFFLAWKFRLVETGTGETALAGFLARMILGLSVVKLLQKKSDRDWMFLYLISFFQILLAAALSISPLYLATLILYLFISVLAIITFEIRKTARVVQVNEIISDSEKKLSQTPFRKLSVLSLTILIFVVIFAVPLFFLLPRVGGAGFGGSQSGISTMIGFSDQVRLGEIGRIQQNDATVMRVRIENESTKPLGGLRWRGIALDKFENNTWKQSGTKRHPFTSGERGFFLLNFPSARPNILIQTIYLEPIDTPILFLMGKPLVVQGSFEDLKKDEDDGLSFSRQGFERISYKVQSDIGQPPPEKLRQDNAPYRPDEAAKYLQLPENLDQRIGELAFQLTKEKTNRYDKAKVIEDYLQTQFGYSLEMKASGEQPVADFLFNVREGHCEYFASAMVLMLRTQGIAARIVNGFQQGEYNETAGVYVVKQKNAHSWVEVYFPKEKTWVTFDPTPFAGQNLSGERDGLFGIIGKYLEAMESFWIQYFVAFDNQEQRSLFRSFKDGFANFQVKLSAQVNSFQGQVQDWWADVRGDRGVQASLWAIAYGVGYLLAFIAVFGFLQWLYRRLTSSVWKQKLIDWWKGRKQKSVVQFYEQMQKILERNGLRREPHQTPLEFALTLNMPEAVKITEKYNRVRFGEKELSEKETEEIENWLAQLEKSQKKESRASL